MKFCDDTNFWFILGNLLDEVKRNQLILEQIEEPQFKEDRLNSLFVSSIHCLLNRLKMPVPMWILQKKFQLKDPYFPSGSNGVYRIFVLRESPAEFKLNNIFVGENFLDRC